MQKSPKNISKELCTLCNKKFNGMFVSQHQCKRCLRYVCKQCCSKKKQIFTLNFNNHFSSKTGFIKTEQHRACDLCITSSDQIIGYIKKNTLNFNTCSKIGHQWLEIIAIDKSDIIINSKSNKIQNAETIAANKKNDNNKISQIWVKGTSSFRQLLGLSLSSKITVAQGNQIIQKISTSQQSNNLAAYILCHCDQNSASEIFSYISALKVKIDIDNAIKQYIQILLQHKTNNTYTQNQNKKILKNLVNYIHSVGYNLLDVNGIFLNTLELEIVNHIIHEVLLAGSNSIIELTVAYLVFQFKDVILGEKVNDEELKEVIRQTITLNKLDMGVKTIRKLIMKKCKKQSQHHSTNNNNIQQKINTIDLPISKNQYSQSRSQVNNKTQQNNSVLSKIEEAAQYLRKIQENQISEEDTDPEQIADLQKYLDLIIQQNQQAINQVQKFDGMLCAIENQLYKNKQS